MLFSALRSCVLALSLLGFTTVANGADLIISAAASLTNAFEDMKPLFEAAHPETALVFNFAASGTLLKQMEQGAPVDVFASADQETMDKAEPLLLPTSRTDFTGNALVLIVPTESTSPVATPEDLQNEAIKLVAIGNPESVPVGRYTKGALSVSGLYETLAPKFVLAESVRQVLDYVARGEVQAGFVYASDAALRSDKTKVVAEISGTKPIVYPIAVLNNSAQKDLAQAFIALVRGPEGQAILAKYGFKQL